MARPDVPSPALPRGKSPLFTPKWPIAEAVAHVADRIAYVETHTPGPWIGTAGEDDWHHVIKSTDERGAVVATVENLGDESEEAANARLIAAAPELLGALEWITRCGFMRGPAGTTAYFISDERMAAARAAVARAKGAPPAPLPESVRGELLTVLDEIAERADSNAADLDPELDAHGGFIRIRDDALAAVAKAKGNL